MSREHGEGGNQDSILCCLHDKRQISTQYTLGLHYSNNVPSTK